MRRVSLVASAGLQGPPQAVSQPPVDDGLAALEVAVATETTAEDAVRRERQRFVALDLTDAPKPTPERRSTGAQASSLAAPRVVAPALSRDLASQAGPAMSGPTLELPNEIWLQVRGHLTGKQLALSRGVSRSWQAAAEDVLLPYRSERLAHALTTLAGQSLRSYGPITEFPISARLERANAAVAMGAQALLRAHFAGLPTLLVQADAQALVAWMDKQSGVDGAGNERDASLLALAALHDYLRQAQPVYAALAEQLAAHWAAPVAPRAAPDGEGAPQLAVQISCLCAALTLWRQELTGADLLAMRQQESHARQQVARLGTRQLFVGLLHEDLATQLSMALALRAAAGVGLSARDRVRFAKLRGEEARLWQFVWPNEVALLASMATTPADQSYVYDFVAAALAPLLDDAQTATWCLPQTANAQAYRALLAKLGPKLQNLVPAHLR